MLPPTHTVREVQGLYGPLSLSERVIQWIWANGHFNSTQLKTLNGHSLEIVSPGIWNHAEGPDFKSASFLIEGSPVNGDVEIHFDWQDWNHHGHSLNQNFNNVVLHVIVFPPPATTVSIQKSDTVALTHHLALLPYLNQDLEGYAEDYAREIQDGVSAEWLTPLLALPAHDRFSHLYHLALARWQQKLTHHRQLIEKFGWQQACHLRTLEILGYKRNRLPMLEIAQTWSPEQFLEMSPEAHFASKQSTWKLRGSRPANHPLKRLQQYHRLLTKNPQWFADAEKALSELPHFNDLSLSTQQFRKRTGGSAFAKYFGETVLARTLPDTRMNTLLADALYPLYSAHTGLSLHDYWFHALPGDTADTLKKSLKQCDLITREYPLSHGILQGLLQYAYTCNVL